MKSKNYKKHIDIVYDDKKRQTVWKIITDVYNEFSSQSTIHGIKYTSQAKSTIGRCLWALIVFLSILAAWQLANEFYKRHESASMRTLVISNSYPSWKLELPAVTLCHSDVVTLHRLSPYLVAKKHLRMPFGITLDDFRKSLKYLSIGILPNNQFEAELRLLERVLSTNRMALEDLFDRLSPRCKDFIVMCQFEGRTEDCDSLISSSYTPHGICCSFNYAYIKSERRWNITGRDYHTVRYGGRYILSFLLKSYGPKDRISSIMYGDGIKVLIHERNTYPGPASLEFVAPTGHETVARLYGRHLTASAEVLNMQPKDRDCEKSTSAENPYRADNCYVRCREKAFFRFCGCLPFFSSVISAGQTICNISHTACLTRVKQKAYSLTLRDPICGCLPDCESTMYSMMTTSVPFNAPQFNPSKFYQKAREIRNATAIHITYSEQSAMLQRRELVLSWINLVSSLGGVFSLFLGCSFISLFEIVYFFVIYFIMKLRDARRAENTNFRTA